MAQRGRRRELFAFTLWLRPPDAPGHDRIIEKLGERRVDVVYQYAMLRNRAEQAG